MKVRRLLSEQISETKELDTAHKHLMCGVDHMIPFVIAGGILMVIAFLIDALAGYGATAGSAFGSATPLAAFFTYIGELAMGLMLPVLSGYIAFSIAGSSGIPSGFVGGLLAAKGNALAASFGWEKLSAFGSLVEKIAF
ncbi:MAG: PTS fructose transporter subunit IIC, partial [Lachnospiraceae bacterium]|nr:PTS fructose transporter subunit IIC [Lachnospiraceae bacterium]